MLRDTIDLSFGRGHLAVAPPEGSVATVIRKGALTKLTDGPAAIRQAFEARSPLRPCGFWRKAVAAPAS